MKRQIGTVFFPGSLLIMVFLVWGILQGGCTKTQQAGVLPGGKQDGLPVDTAGLSLKRGLEAVYFYGKLRHVDEIPVSEKGVAKFGHPGPPIYKLDNEFGKGEVFNSGRSMEVAVLMRGYLHLDLPGEYLFQTQSNDGVQLFINGNLIVSDPGVHGDKLSEPGKFNVVRGGIFPVEVRYFQRKGTASLKLFWQQPRTGFFAIVPSIAYSHPAK